VIYNEPAKLGMQRLSPTAAKTSISIRFDFERKHFEKQVAENFVHLHAALEEAPPE
jgi:hypothetical protein